MKNTIKVFIIALKQSKRVKKITSRLKKFKINYKIINGIDGNQYFKKKKLHTISDKKKILFNTGREMSPSEIGAAASHIKIYKLIVKKKILQAIIMEDDALPSQKISKWISNKIKVENNEIISFYSNPGGYLEKNSDRYVFDDIKVHRSKTHLYNSACYQINNFTCKKILKITNGKVIGFPDWPFNTLKHKISLNVTIPFLSITDDGGKSFLRDSRNKILKKNKEYNFKNILPKKIVPILSFFYYFFFIQFFFSKKKSFFNYLEHFFIKKLYILINFFTNFYIDHNKTYWNIKFYAKDLHPYIKKIVKKQI
jgi:GR25 family glycosyltransferase involved in LPS biosynthesis